MHALIQKVLTEIESAEHVRILYACESGSRAWGFPSLDSDYDVRFIYARPADWYMSPWVEHKPDVIERPLTDNVDLSGWDIRKTLQLLRKSNPPLLEWLGSPIVYFERPGMADKLRTLLPEQFSPLACMYHYLHMARNSYKDLVRGDQVSQKKYFYILRPILAIRWLESGRGVMPTEFGKLAEAMLPNKELKRLIAELIERKKGGEELGLAPPIQEVSAFIDAELNRHETSAVELPVAHPGSGASDAVFRGVVEEIWR